MKNSPTKKGDSGQMVPDAIGLGLIVTAIVGVVATVISLF